jgi:hypothetical protein
VIALLRTNVFRLEGATVDLPESARDTWPTTRAPETTVTAAKNAERLVFKSFINR